jgi:hypothetical protein
MAEVPTVTVLAADPEGAVKVARLRAAFGRR